MIADGAAPVLRRPGRSGAMLASASLPLHLILSPDASTALAALVLALIAGVYVGFALRDGRTGVIATEILVAVGFAGAAMAGLVVSAWAIPTAYALHGAWDVAHHRHVGTAMPRWYVPFCAVFDWVFAIGLSAVWVLRS